MPNHSRRDRSTADSDIARNEGSSESSEVVANERDTSRPWYESLFAGLFGGGSDREREAEAPAVSVEDPIVDEAIEAATRDSDNADSESSMLEAAAEELTTEQQYKLEEDMHVTAQEGGDKVTLASGSNYTVTEEDVRGGYRGIARNHGTTADKLAAFNDGAELVAGNKIYIPSPEERLFAEYRAKYGFEEAVTQYYAAKEGPTVAVYTAASDRASGEVGESYGTKGIEGGKFMTPNPEIAGASSRRSTEVNGITEYKVFWIADFWKCSIFMNDAVWQGGYEPALKGNKHYSVAGRAHQQATYSEVDAANAKPGDAWQRWGGNGSDESHNAVLSSFVEVEDIDADRERWNFKIIGAESDRAAESERSKVMKKGTNETTDGKRIRFLRPNTKRE